MFCWKKRWQVVNRCRAKVRCRRLQGVRASLYVHWFVVEAFPGSKITGVIAGTTGGARIGLNYRNQWPGIASKFESYSFAADIYNPVFNGGLGFLANSHVEGGLFLRSTRIGLIQSFERVMPRFVRFRAGYEVSFVRQASTGAAFKFTDNLDPVLGLCIPPRR